MEIKVSDLISNFVASKGCDTVFTVTGGGAMHMNDSFGHHPSLHCIYNHNEQGSSVAAEGYARTEGKPAVVCVTSGPGGTNAITGVMGAWVDSIPMFVVSGQVKFTTTIKSVPNLKLRQLGDQEFNIVDSIGNMTKYSAMITDENEILYHLEKAWYFMNSGRKGPVWLDVPLNIQGAKVEEEKLKHFDINEIEQPKYDTLTKNDLNELSNLIKTAHKPVLFAGTAIRNESYTEKFVEFAERINIPVVTAWDAHDTISDSNRLYCGRPGTVGTRAGNFVVQNSDLLIVIGSQLNIRQISYNWENFAKNSKIVLVDFDMNEIKKPTLKVYKYYYMDLKYFIDTCLTDDDFNMNNHIEWLKWCKEIQSKYGFNYALKDSQEKANPYSFMRHFSELLSEGDTIVCSNGSACVVTFQSFIVKKNQRLFTNSGCASMGYGLPAAIGSAVCRKGNRVICIEGDGSLQMNIQELATLSYNKLNLKLVVLNNSGYHSIRQTQKNLFSSRPMVGVDCNSGVWIPSMEKIANAYELPYYRVNKSYYDEEVEKFLNEKGPAVLEVIVDTAQNFEPKLSSKVMPDGKIVSPPIDDMYPFMDRKEYDSIKFED